MSQHLILTVSGPEHAGKKYVLSAVHRVLEELGMTVNIIGGDDHLHEKVTLDNEQLAERLKGVEIFLMDQRTS